MSVDHTPGAQTPATQASPEHIETVVDQESDEIRRRIRSLREDLDISMQEMARATGRSVAEYAAQESGKLDLTFTFIYKCAAKLGVDVTDLLTGESPHLTSFSLVRKGEGISIKRRAGFEYLHVAPTLAGKLAEPFVVTIPYSAQDEAQPIHLSYHKGQELDYVISGRLRFSYEGEIFDLNAGDTVMYDSGRGHGEIAIGGAPCVILAVVIEPHGEKIV